MVKHLKIREQLLETISTMKPDDMLPKERDLAETFAVSRTTVRQALQSLIEEGRIYSLRGKGTFVSQGRISKGLTLTSFSEDMRARNLEPASRLITSEERSAEGAEAHMLELSLGEPLYFLKRLRLADGIPMCLERSHLPANLFPRLLSHNLDGSLYQLLASHYRTTVSSAEQHISAQALRKRDADLLGARAGTPALLVRRRGIDSRGRIVEYGQSLYRADRYDFELTIHR